MLTLIAGLFSGIAVLPLIAVLIYVLIKGGQKISFTLFTELPPPPGLEGGGIGNAIIGSFVVTIIAALIAIPVGVGGGIFLAEYSRVEDLLNSSALEPTFFQVFPQSLQVSLFTEQSLPVDCCLATLTALLPAVWHFQF
ncbi:putative phosphate ABC transporter [Synechococcus sp. WH 7805]|nr:putative phosphate ABC transporter [Synechococcus sp. WH 7805]